MNAETPLKTSVSATLPTIEMDQPKGNFSTTSVNTDTARWASQSMLSPYLVIRLFRCAGCRDLSERDLGAEHRPEGNESLRREVVLFRMHESGIAECVAESGYRDVLDHGQ
jgi:hypothetical protein